MTVNVAGHMGGAMLVNTFNRRNIAMMLGIRISQCQQSTAGLKVKYYLLFSENCIFSQSADGCTMLRCFLVAFINFNKILFYFYYTLFWYKCVQWQV